MTLAELEERLSIEEYYEWMILESIEPFGERAAYLRAGLSFDFEKGIGKAPQQSLNSGRGKSRPTDQEAIQAAMHAMMKENPGKIRMRPKPN